MPQPAPESTFLKILFATLGEQGCRYAVMRNYEPLPDRAGGSDLDLLVGSGHGTLAKKLILEAIHHAGGSPIGITESSGFFKIYALGKMPDSSRPWWGLRIDVNVGLFFKGQRLLDDSNPIPSRLHHNIPVLDDGLSGVLGILKEALNNGRYPLRYAQTARKAAQEDWPRIKKLLSPMGNEALNLLHSLLLSTARPEELVDACLQVRRSLLLQSFLHRPFASLWRRAKYEWFKVTRYLKPSGIVIAVLGVDGAGKSTIINAIKPVLDSATHNATVVKHLRPGLLPPLARFKGTPAVAVNAVQNPHGSKPSGTLGSLARLGYLMLDYTIGYWLIIRPQIAKQPTVVVYDRYAFDLALDPRRFRIALPGAVIRRVSLLAPRPDMLFCLAGNPDIIHGRKQEITLEETKRQIEAMRGIAHQHPNAAFISTDQSIQETCDHLLSALLQWLRASKHNGGLYEG